MTTDHGAAEQHMAAALHHEHALRHHRNAAWGYMAQKSHPDPTQQITSAHVHALRTIDDGNSVNKYYAKYDCHGRPNLPEFISYLPAEPTDIAWNTKRDCGNAEHHIATACHHEQAAQYHRKASRHCAGRDYAMALHAAQIAHRHAKHAIFRAAPGTRRFDACDGESLGRNQSVPTTEWIDEFDMISAPVIARKTMRKLGCTVAVTQP